MKTTTMKRNKSFLFCSTLGGYHNISPNQGDGVLKLESPIVLSYIATCKMVTPRPDCYVLIASLSLLPHENLNRLPYLSFYMYKMRILPMNKISMSLSYELINIMVLDLEESKFSTNIY